MRRQLRKFYSFTEQRDCRSRVGESLLQQGGGVTPAGGRCSLLTFLAFGGSWWSAKLIDFKRFWTISYRMLVLTQRGVRDGYLTLQGGEARSGNQPLDLQHSNHSASLPFSSVPSGLQAQPPSSFLSQSPGSSRADPSCQMKAAKRFYPIPCAAAVSLADALPRPYPGFLHKHL